MSLNFTRTTAAAAPMPILTATRHEAEKTITRGEKGRRAILAGWLITMLGIVAYIVAMSRAGENAGILDALGNQGLLGWSAAALLLGGVVVWLVGNLAVLHDLSEAPGGDDGDID
jgi:hypothetical protein